MTEPAYTTAGRTKYLIVAIAVILAFFAAYGFAVSRNASADIPAGPALYADDAAAPASG